MLLSEFLVCVVALALATLLLLITGSHVPVSSRIAGLVLAGAVAWGAGSIATRIWGVPAGSVDAAWTVIVACTALLVVLRPRWNPIAQTFAGAAVGSSLTYLSFGVLVTFGYHLSPVASIASGFLLVLEFAALALSASFAFESFDVLCTPRPVRRPFHFDPSYRPLVSLHIAAYNEPPDMLIETINSVEAIDYPALEIVVIDNNTKDPSVWRPVFEYSRGRDRVRFIHVDPWPGYKSGALNLLLEKYTNPNAELIGVIDADYLVDPDYLKSVVGYFADPNLAFLQTPQDYREYQHDDEIGHVPHLSSVTRTILAAFRRPEDVSGSLMSNTGGMGEDWRHASSVASPRSKSVRVRKQRCSR